MKKHTYRIFIFTSLFFLIFQTNVNSQTNTSSPYSRFGIGDIEPAGFGKSLSMGGIGIAQSDVYEINMLNPASNSSFEKERFLFEFGLRSKITNSTATERKTSTYNNGLASVAGGFRINKFWTSSFSIAPLSSVGYSMSASDSVVSENFNNQNFTQYVGKGGLNSYSFANSFEYKGFSAGIKASYINGRLNKQSSILIKENSYASTIFKDESYNISDFSFLYGLQYKYSNNKIDSLADKFITVGIIYSPKNLLKTNFTQYATRVITMNGISLRDTLANDTLQNGNISLPSIIGLGFGFENKKIMVGIDYTQQIYNKSVFLTDNINLTNSSSIAVGFQYLENSISEKFIERIRYRAGFHYENTQLFLNNTQIKDYGISFGAGIPLYKEGEIKQNEGTIINVGFEIGQRGQINNNLIKENYYLMNLNFNLGARWFIKRKYH